MVFNRKYLTLRQTVGWILHKQIVFLDDLTFGQTIDKKWGTVKRSNLWVIRDCFQAETKAQRDKLQKKHSADWKWLKQFAENPKANRAKHLSEVDQDIRTCEKIWGEIRSAVSGIKWEWDNGNLDLLGVPVDGSGGFESIPFGLSWRGAVFLDFENDRVAFQADSSDAITKVWEHVRIDRIQAETVWSKDGVNSKGKRKKPVAEAIITWALKQPSIPANATKKIAHKIKIDVGLARVPDLKTVNAALETARSGSPEKIEGINGIKG